jgi:putative ABC transport system permease protein
MKPMLGMAARSAWNRRFALSLVVISIALSTFLLLGMERVRKDMRAHFSNAVSGTDLIVGARAGSVQLLLYSVFRIGAASNNIRWASVEAIAKHPQVAWAVPISLGDSHRGFAVVATTTEYFGRFRYGDRQALAFSSGQAFGKPFEAALGADVAASLGYKLGDRIVLAHGDGALEENDHAKNPFTVVGVLARTGTPVDRSVHIDLPSMDALHAEAAPAPGGPSFGPLPPNAGTAPAAAPANSPPKSVTAVLVGLKSRAAVFSMQRWVADYRGEPLQALLPGVALDELWELVGIAERSLLAMGAMVFVVGLAGMVAVILAGLDERRRELAILRAVGAAPRHVMALLALESALITLGGVLLGIVATYGVTVLASGWAQSRFGIALRLEPPAAGEWTVVGAMLAAGLLAGLLPGLRAYRLSLADGLSPRI